MTTQFQLRLVVLALGIVEEGSGQYLQIIA
jgi:hypothetical protein